MSVTSRAFQAPIARAQRSTSSTAISRKLFPWSSQRAAAQKTGLSAHKSLSSPERVPTCPVLKPREVIAILTALGFREVRQRGSRKQFRHDDGRATTVLVHRGRDVSPIQLRHITRDIGLTVKEFPGAPPTWGSPGHGPQGSQHCSCVLAMATGSYSRAGSGAFSKVTSPGTPGSGLEPKHGCLTGQRLRPDVLESQPMHQLYRAAGGITRRHAAAG